MDKYSELRLAAKNATQGDWRYSRSGANSIVQASVILPRGGNSSVVLCKLFRSEWRGELNTAHDAAFIAAANPAVVLALLAELEAKDKRIADLEAKLTHAEKHIADDEEYIEKLESAWKRINELEINEKQMLRDHYYAEDALVRRRNELESALDGMYEAVTGRSPAWGCGFWEDEAVKEVAQIHAELEARLKTPERLPAAKDNSRGWTIDPDYLSAIAEKVGHSEDEGSPSMETVEAVLLATGFTVGNETANVAPAEGQLVTAMGYQGGRNS